MLVKANGIRWLAARQANFRATSMTKGLTERTKATDRPAIPAAAGDSRCDRHGIAWAGRSMGEAASRRLYSGALSRASRTMADTSR